ncbi:unnamed protein product [Durusdinium trenchii]|uniref:Uncharacterized protein n=2 Tax=Durusdinium trenchii TaxID=1381693 RepID=A0ABP0QK00_9DINO
MFFARFRQPVYKTVLMCPPSSSRPKLPNYQNLTPWVRIFFFAHTYYAYIYTFYMFVFAFYKGYAQGKPSVETSSPCLVS